MNEEELGLRLRAFAEQENAAAPWHNAELNANLEERLMAALEEHGPLTPAEAEKIVFRNREYVRKSFIKLAQAGLVQWRRHPDNHRIKIYSLTEV